MLAFGIGLQYIKNVSLDICKNIKNQKILHGQLRMYSICEILWNSRQSQRKKPAEGISRDCSLLGTAKNES